MAHVIGITAKRSDPAWLEQKLNFYLKAVTNMGAQPLVISPNREHPAAPDLTGLDGLIISGGDDVDPALYGDERINTTELDPLRDALEINLVRLALARRLPLLGICRGVQVMNVALGGGLVQNVEGHIIRHHDDPLWLQHDVQLTHYSKLAAIFQKPLLTVNSRHHQVVDPGRLGRGVNITALSMDERPLIEAIEVAEHPWALGVQWHPERTEEVPQEQTKLFEAFAEAAVSIKATAPRV